MTSPKAGDSLSPDDVRDIQRLLQEYTRKLEDDIVAVRTYRQREREQLFWSFVSGVAALVVGSAATLYLDTQFPIVVSAGFIALAAVFYALRLIFTRARRLDESHDLMLSAAKLARLTAAGSQFMEHTRPAFASRLELELRLTEAENAISRAARTTGFRTDGMWDYRLDEEVADGTSRRRGQ
jgi:hypothetical protein